MAVHKDKDLRDLQDQTMRHQPQARPEAPEAEGLLVDRLEEVVVAAQEEMGRPIRTKTTVTMETVTEAVHRSSREGGLVTQIRQTPMDHQGVEGRRPHLRRRQVLVPLTGFRTS